MEITCSDCGTGFTVTDDRAGSFIDCPYCGRPRLIPRRPPPSPPPSDSAPPKIRFRCPGCHKVYKANASDAGRKVSCKTCSAVLSIPLPRTDTREERTEPPTPPGEALEIDYSEGIAPALGPVREGPPLEFLCPSCRSRMRIGRTKGGTEVRCAKCHQRVIVPKPVDEALPGILPADEPPPLPPPPTPDTRDVPFELPEPEPDFSDDDPEDYEPPGGRYRRRRRRSGLVTAVAILYLVQGILSLLCCAILSAGGAVLSKYLENHPAEQALTGGLIFVLCVFIVVLSIPDFFAAYGVWHRQEWGRIVAIVLGVLNGVWALASIFWFDPFSFFTGTAICTFTLVVLLQSRYADEFR